MSALLIGEEVLKKIFFKPKLNVPEGKCSGCRYCEVICSYFHVGECNPKRAAIHVSYDGHGTYVPNFCRHCKDPPCLNYCPTEAIKVNELGRIEIIKDKCNGCGSCVENCPFGGIFLYIKSQTAIVCDLCNGDPQCVKYCTPGVLILKDEESKNV